MSKAVLFFGSFLVGLFIQDRTVPTLTLRDCVEISADYEILHPVVPEQTTWYGVTDEFKIFAIKNANLKNRRKTILHEMFHASLSLHDKSFPRADEEEAAVREQTDILYQELFP